MRQLQIGSFVVAANIVDLASAATFQNRGQGFAVVFYMQPVTHILTIAIKGDLLAGEQIRYEQRDDFFRELIAAEVIGTSCDDGI